MSCVRIDVQHTASCVALMAPPLLNTTASSSSSAASVAVPPTSPSLRVGDRGGDWTYLSKCVAC
jgi:hypothetical protein